MSLIDPEADLVFARRLADAARGPALSHFRTGLRGDNKAARGFDPVTRADTEIEAALRALIAAERPGDGVRGEEAAPTASTTGRVWTLDPIDGTRAYIAGLTTWCTLIALDAGDEPELSVIDQPVTAERFVGLTAGEAPGAWLERNGGRRALRVRAGARLADAIGATTDPFLFAGAERAAVDQVRGAARLMRYGLDAYGYAALAMGGVDFVVESGLMAWDVAALIPVVRGAGGVITDWSGGPCHGGGQVVAAASADLHAELLDHLAAAKA